MKLTNNTNLPPALYERIKADILSDPYDRESEECISFRTTELIGAPLPTTLFNQYRDSDKLVIDAKHYLAMVFGTCFHTMCEGEDTETIIYESKNCVKTECNGQSVKIYGTVDEIEFVDGCVDITDNKTSVVSHMNFPVKDDYIAQVNVYSKPYRRMFDGPIRLRIRYFLKDFSVIASANNPKLPQSQMVYKNVDLWPDDRLDKFIQDRLADHIDNPERPCTKEERNFGTIKYKIKHPDSKKAIKASYMDHAGKRQDITTMEKAQELLSTVSSKYKAKAFIEKQADDIKCKYHCAAVSVCPYAKSKGYRPL